MTLSDLEWLGKIFNDAKRRAVSLRQLSFLFSPDPGRPAVPTVHISTRLLQNFRDTQQRLYQTNVRIVLQTDTYNSSLHITKFALRDVLNVFFVFYVAAVYYRNKKFFTRANLRQVSRKVSDLDLFFCLYRTTALKEQRNRLSYIAHAGNLVSPGGVNH